MSDDNKPPDESAVNVDVTAKAEVSAKAEIKGEVPTTVMGRLGNALADALSPFTEKRGLKGDMIRMQREELAAQRVQGALDKINAQGLEITPPPLKFMIPYLEKVSIEDEDDPTLNEMWENLLATAATEYEKVHPSFAQILSETTASEAKLANRFKRQSTFYAWGPNYSEAFKGSPEEHEMQKLFDFLEYKKVSNGVFELIDSELLDGEKDKIFDAINQHTMMFQPVVVRVPMRVDTNSPDTSAVIILDKDSGEATHLVRQGLAQVNKFLLRPSCLNQFPDLSLFSIEITFIQLTELGVRLINACTSDEN